ncbi:MAG: hypothetical protein R3C56_12930 [Pirellulaceae bacterium]
MPSVCPGKISSPASTAGGMVNYIINREDLTNTTSFTQDDFINLLDDIQGACGRPLGISVINMDGGEVISPLTPISMVAIRVPQF